MPVLCVTAGNNIDERATAKYMHYEEMRVPETSRAWLMCELSVSILVEPGLSVCFWKSERLRAHQPLVVQRTDVLYPLAIWLSDPRFSTAGLSGVSILTHRPGVSRVLDTQIWCVKRQIWCIKSQIWCIKSFWHDFRCSWHLHKLKFHRCNFFISTYTASRVLALHNIYFILLFHTRSQ